MWIQRTPEEIADWHEATQREARSHGRLVAGFVSVAVVALAAGGWLVSFRGGLAAQNGTTAGIWARMPIIAILALPFAWFLYRRETRSELEKLLRRTICPKCETSGEHDAGTICQCGGTWVSASTVKWVEVDQDCAVVAE